MNQSIIQSNYQNLIASLSKNTELVAVSKTHPVEDIKLVYDLGQRIFGENKVQELAEKQPRLPEDIQWHLIGHLQTNKVKYIAAFVNTIQSVDSEKLLAEINKQAEKYQRKINILLQIKIAEEDSKTGLELEDANKLVDKIINGDFPFVELSGLMGMATFTDDQQQIRREFLSLKKTFDLFSQKKPLKTLSMGMSGDYRLAIECGATSVRVGSAIFGNRNYHL